MHYPRSSSNSKICCRVGNESVILSTDLAANKRSSDEKPHFDEMLPRLPRVSNQWDETRATMS